MDLSNSIINTIYLTFSHNQAAIAFFIGIIISITLSIIKPTRYSITLMIGFIILLIGFEYNKHIVTPFYNQTMQSLDFGNSQTSIKKLTSTAIIKLLPILFFFLGWGAIFGSIIYAGLKMNKK